MDAAPLSSATETACLRHCNDAAAKQGDEQREHGG